MDINLKDNIWIEGFECFEYLFDYMRNPGLSGHILNDNIIYKGKTSEISEELAIECVELLAKTSLGNFYRNYRYGKPQPVAFTKCTAKESVKSACDKEYCIIYKC